METGSAARDQGVITYREEPAKPDHLGLVFLWAVLSVAALWYFLNQGLLEPFDWSTLLFAFVAGMAAYFIRRNDAVMTVVMVLLTAFVAWIIRQGMAV